MAMVRKYRSRVVSVAQAMEGVFTVIFESLDKKYKFKPGQFLHLTVDSYDPAMAWPESRCFSIQSPPADSDIKITFSKKGTFTKRMSSELTVGKEVTLKMPYGDLFQKAHKKENAIFIAGGTGITPFLSLFNDKHFEEYQDARLYLGIRNQRSHIYQDDLNKALVLNSSLKVQIVNQATNGLMKIEQIIKDNEKDSTYFVSGPPGMITYVKDNLTKNDVRDIRTDDWE
jgi:ferredoxin-NADP reductase